MGVSNIAEFRKLIADVQLASDPKIRIALRRLAAETKDRLADASPYASDFFVSLRISLAQLKGNANADLRVGCLYDCARFFYISGDTLKGISAARDGVALAKAVRNDGLARKGLTFLGNLLADSGVVGEGIECHVSAIALATKLKDLDGKAISTLNLGVALIYASQYQDALSCFDWVLSSAPNGLQNISAEDNIHRRALANKALCYLRMNKISEGIACAQRSISEGIPHSGPEALTRVIRECSLIQLLLEAGEISLAAQRVGLVRDLARQTLSQKTAVMSAIVEGLLEIHRGDSSRGIALLREAKDQAGTTESLVQDALVALVKGYDLLGQPARALESLEQLMQRVGAARKQCALLHLQTVLPSAPSQHEDLSELRHREAILRAKVAEDRLLSSQIEMLERLAVTADLREEATGEHGYRVGRLSSMLAEAAGMDAAACLAIDLAARLHDIGKIAIPDRILLTSETLKEAERHFMCQHTVMGAELLAQSSIAQLRIAEEIALNHHEWWDGTGYPRKIGGKRIPLHARIVALADVFDALTHGRPYAEPWDMDRAIEEIRKRRGTQFDPDLTDRFVELIATLREEQADLDTYLGKAARRSPFLQARRKIKLMLEQEREHERRHTFPGNETRH